jgi:hypothetical protein
VATQLKMPDITPAQIAAVGTAIVGFAAAAGIPMSNDLQDKLITMITVGAPVIIVADAYIRNGRARIGAAQVTAAANAVAQVAEALPATNGAPAIQAAPEATAQALAAAPETAAVPATTTDAATAAPGSLSQLLESGAISELAQGGVLAIKPEEELFVVRWVRPEAAPAPPAEPAQPATPAGDGSA